MTNNMQFNYIVETLLWKSPFDDINDDLTEYLNAKKEKYYIGRKIFCENDPFCAREKALSFCQSMIEVLCESIGVEYKNYWQSLCDLQPMLRAEHKFAHVRVGGMSFDDDMMMGIRIILQVKNGNDNDNMEIFSLCRYGDDRREEILENIVGNIVELDREVRYYHMAEIDLHESRTFDFNPIGLPEMNLLPTLFDFDDFLENFNGCSIDECVDFNRIMDRSLEDLMRV